MENEHTTFKSGSNAQDSFNLSTELTPQPPTLAWNAYTGPAPRFPTSNATHMSKGQASRQNSNTLHETDTPIISSPCSKLPPPIASRTKKQFRTRSVFSSLSRSQECGLRSTKVVKSSANQGSF
ncbi:hypothetical protein Droror1_Dr00018042 [Drosera rotundifolia]